MRRLSPDVANTCKHCSTALDDANRVKGGKTRSCKPCFNERTRRRATVCRKDDAARARARKADCRHCGVELTEENRHSGGEKICRRCQNDNARALYAAHRDDRRRARKAAQDRSRDAVRAWYRRYYDDHKEHIERCKLAARVAAPERYRAYNRKFLQRNPWYAAEMNRRRRAALSGSLRTLTREEWSAILDYFDHRCAYCLRCDVKLTLDHVQAIACGGDHVAANVVPACGQCNTRKQAKGVLRVVNEPRWAPPVMPTRAA